MMSSGPLSSTAAWVYLLAGCAFSNAANITLAAANRGHGMSLDAVVSIPFVASLAMYGAAFILYSRSLSRIALSVAYPIFVGISLIFVSAASFIWLEYPLTPVQVGGLALVFSGIVLVSSSSRAPSRSSESAS